MMTQYVIGFSSVLCIIVTGLVFLCVCFFFWLHRAMFKK